MTDTLCSGLSECARLAGIALAGKGIVTVREKRLVNGMQATLEKEGKTCRINYYWSVKKGFSHVPAGGDSHLLSLVSGVLSGKPVPGAITGLRIGTDEAGKGDWFGPLVAAGVACDDTVAAGLASAGVADSKTLSNRRVLELLDVVRDMNGVFWSSRVVPPPEYNRLFSDFAVRGMNSLDIQAMAHGEVITDLLCRTGAKQVVVDRFCPGERLAPWITGTGFTLSLRCRAEDDPVVAAASIIARGLYLQSLEALSLELGVAIAPGSGAPADTTGRQLVKARGIGVLYQCAKVHFGNYSRIATP
ncbi:MAG: ribonuclease HIII [Candidatus Fermentibacteraceae bacterium]